MAHTAPLRDSDRINLERAVVLLVDDNPQALDILGNILTGFGVRQVYRCASAEQAMEKIKSVQFDLIITDANMPGMDGWELVSWIRRQSGKANRCLPVIVCTGYTRLSQVLKARDCGANFVIAKPLTPRVILERIFWVAGGERPFIECDSYVGPDRRWKQVGPPEGVAGRRLEDRAPAPVVDEEEAAA
jgi:CheY-like chemotaxis protein